MARRAQLNLTVLGYAVRQVREERGMNARELASAAGVRLSVLEAIEAGRLDPTYEVLVSLAQGCELGPATFVLRAEDFAEMLACP